MNAGPSIWILRNDATPRRMRLAGAQLRTIVSYDTMLNPMVDVIEIAAVTKVQVLAPYAPPSRQAAKMLTALAAGVFAASFLQMMTALVLATVLLTFAAVAAIASGSSTRRYSIARLTIENQEGRIISYLQEEEEAVKRLFAASSWANDNVSQASTPLLPEEIRQADKLRIGLVLAASGAGLGILAAIYRIPSKSDSPLMVPVDILQYAAIAIVLFVAAKAWIMMLKTHRRK